MEATFAVVRGIHFAATLLPLGELLFALAVADESWRGAEDVAPGRGGALRRHVVVVVGASLAVGLISGFAWLAVEAASMTGMPMAHALDIHTFALVLGDTEFGHVWCLRGMLLALLAIGWMSIATARNGRAAEKRMRVALTLAALNVASLAWAGHAAAAMQGPLRAIHLASDAAHALAAGAWIGALPGLVFALRGAPQATGVACLARRFSTLGVASVAVLFASGVVNACFLVGSIPALLGTPYGHVLMAKLALFAMLLALAAVNRQRLTPRLADGDAAARATLRRNAVGEIVLGGAIVAIAGALGTMMPAAHESPVWPFDFRLDLSATDLDAGGRATLVASAGIALAGMFLIIAAMRRHAARSAIAGVLALLASTAASLWALAAPAFPSTYAISPVPYTVSAVGRGSERFAGECATCHGSEGRGDGPAARSLPKRPANLVEHAAHHPQGNLYWWIAHGIPGTPMPAFAPRLSDHEIWELVQFLAARSAAQSATTVAGRPVPPGIRVPDFSYELPQQPQQTLLQQRAPALIVLYSLPASEKRLAALASDHALAHGGLRIVGVPIPASAMSSAELAQAIVDANVAPVYGLFARARDGSTPAHAELLVDAAGNLRARWLGLPANDREQDAAIAAAAQQVSTSDGAAQAPPMQHKH